MSVGRGTGKGAEIRWDVAREPHRCYRRCSACCAPAARCCARAGARRRRAGSGCRAFPVATDARLGGDAKQTRFVVDLTRKIEIRAFTLADPYRVVIDLPQVTFQLPARAGEHGRGLIKAFRYGLVMPGGSRIVLDTTGPVRVDKAFVLEPADGQPARLVLDLVAGRPRDLHARRARSTTARRAAETRAPTRAAGRASGDPRPLIVIDPGPRRHRHRHPRAARRRDGKDHRARFRRRRCATSSRRPASTAW